MYPYGASLNVAQPSVVVMSSGSIAVPTNRPICAFYSKSTRGKLVCLGSYKIFTDAYIDRERNDWLRELIFDFFDSELTAKDVQPDDLDVRIAQNVD